ncbi:UNVERIFIED_CONTAM: hypothetical protein Sradi_7245600 [Sesamum radiatum]|uniref:Uncharacterized protein n=1 Tax=Sesamum radiatum TaxID=300843 RepID=A0AAW2IKX9_SESRA
MRRNTFETAEFCQKYHNGASPVVHVAELGESYACICSSGRSSTRAQSYASRKIRRTRVAPAST